MKQFQKEDRTVPQRLGRCFGGIAIAASLFILQGCGGENKEDDQSENVAIPLRFSAIPDENTTGQTERFRPVVDYLAKVLEVEVEFVPSATYGASVEKFENGDIHLAWFGGVSGVQARQAVDGARALAAGKADLAFQSYFVANAATGLTKSEEFPMAIANMTFTFGSSGSTSGYVMPSYFILEKTGKTPRAFFQKTPLGYAGAHDKVALQVQDGTFQTGVLNYQTYERMVEADEIDASKCVVIWETPPFADYNFTAHPDLEEIFGEGFTAELQKALIQCRDPAVLKALGREELVEVTNETFARISEIMGKMELD